MSFPTITIKGNNPDKKKVVEAFLDVCLSNDQLTQHEVLDMIIKKYNENKAFEEDALKYAALNSHFEGTAFTSIEDYITALKSLVSESNAKDNERVATIKRIPTKLELKEDDDIPDAIESLLTSQRHPAQVPSMNSDILADLREFKNSEKGKLLAEMLDDIDMGQEPEPKEIIDVLTKYKVTRDYIKESKPEANDFQILKLILESVHDEIVKSKQA